MCDTVSPHNAEFCYSCGHAFTAEARAQQAAMQRDIAQDPEYLQRLIDERIAARIGST